jgi:hypothetical protein
MDNTITRSLVLAIAIPFPLAHIVLGLANLTPLITIVPAIAAMVMCLLVMGILAAPCPTGRLGTPAALAVITGTTAMTALVQLGLPHGIHPGYAAWHTGALQMLLVALVLRRRSALAWLGTAGFVVVQSLGSALHAMSLLDAVVLMATPLVWIVIATVVSAMLTRSHAAIQEFSAARRKTETRLANAFAAQVARGDWAADLDHRTRPALESIAAGRITDTDRQDYLLLEAELRDQIRGRTLVGPGVSEAARRARMRGVRVELLDDLKVPLVPSIHDEVASQLVATLGRSQGGFVNARAASSGPEQLVRIVAFDERLPESEFTLEISSASRE